MSAESTDDSKVVIRIMDGKEVWLPVTWVGEKRAVSVACMWSECSGKGVTYCEPFTSADLRRLADVLES